MKANICYIYKKERIFNLKMIWKITKYCNKHKFLILINHVITYFL
jgi:hypothetical protein